MYELNEMALQGYLLSSEPWLGVHISKLWGVGKSMTVVLDPNLDNSSIPDDAIKLALPTDAGLDHITTQTAKRSVIQM